jgi:agmatine deiminase
MKNSAKLRMPAEWEKHEATWLAWPHQRADWPGKFAAIPYVFVEIIKHITSSEICRLIVKDAAMKKQALELLKNSSIDVSKVEFFMIPTNRGWMRDAGPIYVKDSAGKKIALDWKFNGWAKYANHKLDNKIPAEINKKQKLKSIATGIVMEGGAIDVNGKGTLIATEECLLSKIQERNPGFGRECYDEVFAEFLGIDEIIWLEAGIVGDDTHGHVDDITRFVNEKTIVTAVESNKKDENYKILQNNLKTLKRTKFEIIEIPMPKPVVYEGMRLPASYANFLITNKNVIVPTFNDANDRIALNILADVFKGREIVGVHAVDLVWGLGTIHCLTQQEPA